MIQEYQLTKPYAKGFYNVSDEEIQWIRISEGCPNQCPYCAETWENGKEPIYYELPEIIRNRVNILDMNLIYKPKALEIIQELGRRRVNGKVIYYSLQCGIDYRYLTQEIASALKQAHFIEMRFAWDYSYNQAYKIEDAKKKLVYAGYNPKDMQVFMIANWKIPAKEYLMKLKTLKHWGLQVSDCWFDNQKKGQVIPIHWTKEEIDYVGEECRDHNIMIRHNGIQVEKIKDGGAISPELLLASPSCQAKLSNMEG